MRDDRDANSPATRGARLSRRRLLRRGLAGLALTGSGVATAPTTVRSAESAVRRSATDAHTQPSPPFTQQQKLAPEDGDPGDLFGDSVAVDGATAVIGAFSDENPVQSDDDAGSVYVFEQQAQLEPSSSTSGGEWTQQAKLAAADGDSADRFGDSVAVNGDTAVVGAPIDENPNGSLAGSAYVFSRNKRGWTQQAKISAFDGDRRDVFGDSVAVDGEIIIVGAPGDESVTGEDTGAIYVFEQQQGESYSSTSGGEWTVQAKLVAADGDSDDRFGESIAIDGESIIVGASGDTDPTGPAAGAAYVYERAGESWTQQVKLLAADRDQRDRFGDSVAINGDTAVVGAPQDTNSKGDVAGAAYVFARSSGNWSQQIKLTASDGDTLDRFGGAVAINGDTVVIGADEDEDPNGSTEEPDSAAGSAYVFTRRDSGWIQRAKLAATDGDSGDDFGFAVAVDGDTTVIGARTDENPNGPAAGSAYVFSGGDGGQAPVALALEAPETLQPGETVTVTAELINRDVAEPSSGSIELNPVPEPLSLSSDSENPVFLGFAGNALPAVGESVTQQFEIAVPEEAAVEQDLTLEAEAVVQNDTDEFNTTTTQTVTISNQQDPVQRFDTNGEPGIQGDEVLDAISEFNEGGDVEATDVLDVISDFNENSG